MFNGKNAIKCMGLETTQTMGENTFPHLVWREKGITMGGWGQTSGGLFSFFR